MPPQIDVASDVNGNRGDAERRGGDLRHLAQTPLVAPSPSPDNADRPEQSEEWRQREEESGQEGGNAEKEPVEQDQRRAVQSRPPHETPLVRTGRLPYATNDDPGGRQYQQGSQNDDRLLLNGARDWRNHEAIRGQNRGQDGDAASCSQGLCQSAHRDDVAEPRVVEPKPRSGHDNGRDPDDKRAVPPARASLRRTGPLEDQRQA